MKLEQYLTEKPLATQALELHSNTWNRSAYFKLRAICIQEVMGMNLPNISQKEKSLWMIEVIGECDHTYSPSTKRILNLLEENVAVRQGIAEFRAETKASLK